MDRPDSNPSSQNQPDPQEPERQINEAVLEYLWRLEREGKFRFHPEPDPYPESGERFVGGPMDESPSISPPAANPASGTEKENRKRLVLESVRPLPASKNGKHQL